MKGEAMAGTKKKRRSAGDARPYQRESDGMWCVSIEMPPIAGKRQRKVIARKDKADVIEARAEFLVRLSENGGSLPTREVTVREWFPYWLEHNDVRPNTLSGYRSLVVNHIIPTLGPRKLNDLTVDDLRQLTRDMRAKDKRPGRPEKGKLSATYANEAHRVMSIALKAAQAERKLQGTNIAAVMKAPKKSKPHIEVLTLEQSIKVLESVSVNRDPLASLWWTYFLTGARRGEVIGLERDRVTDVIDLSWQMQRLIWRHGCSDPAGMDDNDKPIYRCGRKRGTDCPDRRLKVPDDYEYRNIDGGLYWTRPKSSKGWRIIPLVDPLRSILETHLATTPPNPYGLVWTQQSGWPLDPDQTTRDWAGVLPQVGIRKAVTIHEIRHSTIDLLYDLGIDEEVIMDIVGHSVRSVTRGYRTRKNLGRVNDAMTQFSALFPSAKAELTAD
jgi:integrase